MKQLLLLNQVLVQVHSIAVDGSQPQLLTSVNAVRQRHNAGTHSSYV